MCLLKPRLRCLELGISPLLSFGYLLFSSPPRHQPSRAPAHPVNRAVAPVIKRMMGRSGADSDGYALPNRGFVPRYVERGQRHMRALTDKLGVHSALQEKTGATLAAPAPVVRPAPLPCEALASHPLPA